MSAVENVAVRAARFVRALIVGSGATIVDFSVLTACIRLAESRRRPRGYGRIDVVPPEVVSFLGTFIVFVGFAYPMRKLVIFRIPNDPRAQ